MKWSDKRLFSSGDQIPDPRSPWGRSRIDGSESSLDLGSAYKTHTYDNCSQLSTLIIGILGSFLCVLTSTMYPILYHNQQIKRFKRRIQFLRRTGDYYSSFGNVSSFHNIYCKFIGHLKFKMSLINTNTETWCKKKLKIIFISEDHQSCGCNFIRIFFFIRNITSLQYRVQGLECASKYKPYFIPFTVIWAIMRPRRDPSRTYGVDWDRDPVCTV